MTEVLSDVAAVPARVPLVIVGGGGFGREVLQLVHDINRASPTFDVLGFVDDDPADIATIERLGYAVIGTTDQLSDLSARILIAVGASTARCRLDEMARAAGVPGAEAVHPTATVGRDVALDEGVIVGAGSRLSTNIAVGRHTHVNVNCTVGHDSVLEPYVTVFPGVHISGGCTVEEGATLGSGCVLLPGIRVGRGAEVGAGAVVVRDVAPEAIVVAPAGRPTLRARPDDGGAAPGNGARASAGGRSTGG